MPMLLSEARAQELVNEWTRDCGEVRPAKSTVASCGSPATHLVVSPDFRFHDFAASNALGESLRRAMEGLNTLASCAGLDPSANPAFWRRQFQVFERTFVSRDTMARYTIKLEYTANVNASGVACVLATCLGMRSVSKGIAIRERELAVLREYLVRTPSMLEINVDLAVRSRDPYCEDPVWDRFGRSLRDIYSLWIMEAHTMWHCAEAQIVWHALATAWGAGNMASTQLRSAVFTRQAPATTIDWRSAFQGTTTSIVGDRIAHWLAVLWRQLVTCGLRRLWYNQVHRVYSPAHAVVESSFAATAAWARSVRGSITAAARGDADTKELDHRVLSVIYSRLVTQSMIIPRFSGTTARYVLFFDGGSRGNPGPGGSGSVIVSLYPSPKIIWAASMSYAARSTTNNFAEYKGLCTGLTAATAHQWHPISIIGDSLMIIQQLQHRRRPRAPALLPWYEQARAAADTIQVLGWHHHYRTHNKMADKAANQAMDTGASYQVMANTARPELADLQVWLANDITQWVGDSFSESPRLRHDPALSKTLLG